MFPRGTVSFVCPTQNPRCHTRLVLFTVMLTFISWCRTKCVSVAYAHVLWSPPPSSARFLYFKGTFRKGAEVFPPLVFPCPPPPRPRAAGNSLDFLDLHFICAPLTLAVGYFQCWHLSSDCAQLNGPGGVWSSSQGCLRLVPFFQVSVVKPVPVVLTFPMQVCRPLLRSSLWTWSPWTSSPWAGAKQTLTL